MRRLPDWRKRLELQLDAIERQGFEWGTADCGPGWAAVAVEAVLGIDPAARFRGRYASATGALAIMREEGCSTLADLVDKVLEEATGTDCAIHPSRSRPGDIAAIPDEGPFGFVLGVVNGERILVRRPDGKGTVDLTRATRAWRIGL